VADAFRFIDITKKVLVREMMQICMAIPGAFSVRELMDTDYETYETIIKFVKERQESIKDACD
jgi:hypothetical protein